MVMHASCVFATSNLGAPAIAYKIDTAFDTSELHVAEVYLSSTIQRQLSMRL